MQLLVLLLFVSYLFANIAAIGNPAMFVYGAFIFLMVYAFTELMDNNPYSLLFETLKNIFGTAIIYKTGSWFGAEKIFTQMNAVLIAYFILSNMVTVWYVLKQRRETMLQNNLLQNV